MNPIYKNKSYKFSLTISVNDVPVNISNDQVIAYVNKDWNADTPQITANADLTEGSTGKATIEFDPTQTDLLPGTYKIQVVWKLQSSSREFIVLDDTIKIKSVIK